MEIRKCLCVILWKKKLGDPSSKVLLLQLTPARGGFWQPVTGHVEPGEDYSDAALREAVEESDFVFDRHPQYLGLEYQFDSRFGPVRERAFALWIGGETPPIPVLDPKEHVAYQWVSPEEAQQLLKFDSNKEAVSRASSHLPPLFLSAQGLWFQEGQEITHTNTVELLHRSLQKINNGYLVKIAGEEAEVILEDTPRFVQSYEHASGEIHLLGNEASEILKPETLSIGDANILYCELQNGWRAKFLKSAYYSLAKELEEVPGTLGTKYILHFQGRHYEILVPHK